MRISFHRLLMKLLTSSDNEWPDIQSDITLNEHVLWTAKQKIYFFLECYSQCLDFKVS